MGISLSATGAVASHAAPGPLQEQPGSGISPNPYEAAAGSSETPLHRLSPGLHNPTALSIPHTGAEAGWLRDITAGGTGMVVSHHPKEKQPPSLCSREGLQQERSSSLPAVPTQTLSWHPTPRTQPPRGISALVLRKPVSRKLCRCLWP